MKLDRSSYLSIMIISSSSKLVSFRFPELQNLLRRHLLHPSVAASSRLPQSVPASATNPVPDAHFVDPSRLPKECFFRSLLEESNPRLCFNASFRSFALATGDGYLNPSAGVKMASYDSDDSDSHSDPYDIDPDGGDDTSDEDDDGYCDSEEEKSACYDSDKERPRVRPMY